MKKRLFAALLTGLLFVTALTGCKSNNTADNNSSETAASDLAVTETPETTEAAGDSKAAEELSETDSYAKELISRNITPDDIITEDVIEAAIKELKAEYSFEDVKSIKSASDSFGYIAQKKGWFDELFGDAGIKVENIEGTIGNEAQLMARGDLDFAYRMLYPYLLYRAEGADLTAVQISEHPHAEIVSILVRADSGINTFEDLKGKKIGSWRAGCPYMVLFEKTEKLNWKEGTDWEYVNIPSSEMKTALLAGEVDAISQHPLSSISPVILDGSVKEISNATEDGIYVNGGGSTVVFTTSEFAQENPNIVKAWTKFRDLVNAYIIQNQDAAAAVVESVNRDPAENTEFWWDRSKETLYRSDNSIDQIKEETKAFQDWLIEHGDISEDKAIDVNKLFSENLM